MVAVILTTTPAATIQRALLRLLLQHKGRLSMNSSSSGSNTTTTTANEASASTIPSTSLTAS
jgi:hypothetical protein